MSANAKVVNLNKEVKSFDAEIDKLLNLVIHSLYTNKDIFIRELLSNASDACDKLRYLSQTNDSLLGGSADFAVSIKVDEANNTLTFSDNGVGMDKEDIIANIGSIANSGTKKFLDNLTGENAKDQNLIGQFGVGFYSVFMVADKVEVFSRKAGDSVTYKWESEGKGQYSIESVDNDAELERGTRIILHIKNDEKEFLDKYHIKHVVRTYSDHISLPIEVITYDEIKKSNESEVINSSSALWCRDKKDITKEEYEVFYKMIAKAYDLPYITLHTKVEGKIDYTALLFIPSVKGHDLYNPDRKTSLKLYVKRVFITDDNADLVPPYLRFVKGVVDSSDIMLNVSRETLQNDIVVTKIRESLVKKVLSELAKKMKKDPEGYLEFWKNFGPVIKEGLCEFSNHKNDLLDLCQFVTTKDKTTHRTLKDYIADMKEDQESIYYLSGEDIDATYDSPQVEMFREKNIEVLLLCDGVDHFWVNVAGEYEGKTFVSVTKASEDSKKDDKNEVNEDGSEKVKEESAEEIKMKDFLNYCKEVLADKVHDVQLSTRLTSSPSCLSVPEGSLDIRMERILIEQKQMQQASKKILELNPKNPVIIALENEHKADGENKDNLNDNIMMLFYSACVIEGESIENPSKFAKMINKLMESALDS